MKNHAFVIMVGIINLFALIVYVTIIIFKFDEKELIDLFPSLISIFVSLFTAIAFFDISRTLKELEEKNEKSIFDTNLVSNDKKLRDDLFSAKEEIKKAKQELNLAKDELKAAYDEINKSHEEINKTYIEIENIKNESMRLDLDIKRVELIAQSNFSANNIVMPEANESILKNDLNENYVDKDVLNYEQVNVDPVFNNDIEIHNEEISNLESSFYIDESNDIEIIEVQADPNSNNVTARISKLFTNPEESSYYYQVGDDAVFLNFLYESKKYQNVGDYENRISNVQKIFNESKYDVLNYKIEELLAKNDVNYNNEIYSYLRGLAELGDDYLDVKDKIRKYKIRLDELNGVIIPDDSELNLLDYKLSSVKTFDDLNKIIPEINAIINKYSSYPSKANIILRIKNKVELIKTNLQNEYDKYKFEFSNKVYEAEMYNGRGIVEIIQEYANILSEDDINTIAKKACDLYYSNQNEIFNEYYRKIKFEDDLIEVKKIAQKVFAVEATNVNSSVLEQIKSELYNKANDEYITANIVKKNNLTTAVDIFDLLDDYKNSEYLRNLAYVKSIRSKNYKALVRSLKTAVSNPDYDYNQFLELLDQVDDFSDVLDEDEVKTRYMNKYKKMNNISN